MKLNTGSKVAIAIDFEDRNETENIYFNPSDPDLIVRFGEMEERINKKMEALKDIDLNANGEPKNDDLSGIFKETKQVICEEIDRAFNGDVSSVVFKYCNPFAIVNGSYFIFQFIEAITPEIEKHIKKAESKAQKNMQKHIGKYVK